MFLFPAAISETPVFISAAPRLLLPRRLRASPTEEKLQYLALSGEEEEGRKDPNAVGEVPRGNASRQINSRIRHGILPVDDVVSKETAKTPPPDKIQNNRKQ